MRHKCSSPDLCYWVSSPVQAWAFLDDGIVLEDPGWFQIIRNILRRSVAITEDEEWLQIVRNGLKKDQL